LSGKRVCGQGKIKQGKIKQGKIKHGKIKHGRAQQALKVKKLTSFRVQRQCCIGKRVCGQGKKKHGRAQQALKVKKLTSFRVQRQCCKDAGGNESDQLQCVQYEEDSAPALALKATIERTEKRFATYGKQGLLCGTDGLPHLISDPGLAIRYGHAGETLVPPPLAGVGSALPSIVIGV